MEGIAAGTAHDVIGVTVTVHSTPLVHIVLSSRSNKCTVTVTPDRRRGLGHSPRLNPQAHSRTEPLQANQRTPRPGLMRPLQVVNDPYQATPNLLPVRNAGLERVARGLCPSRPEGQALRRALR